MLFLQNLPPQSKYRKAMSAAYLMDETECVDFLLQQAALPTETVKNIQRRATQLVSAVRASRKKQKGLDSFLYEYDLSSEEGITLMCLAEALLRIPDKKSIDKLIRDKVTAADWKSHAGQSDSLLVNAATWGLMLTGKVLEQKQSRGLKAVLQKVVSRTGQPVIRKAVEQGMKILSRQFVMGRTIEEALKRAESNEAKGYRYSYDMLGEAAQTEEDADRYFQSYQTAIAAIGKAASGKGEIAGPGISVKLSALHPRYEFSQRHRVTEQLVPKVLMLAQQAKQVGIALTIDAEEADRLDLSLDIIEAVFCDESLNGWEGFGVAVQSYQKRAWYVLDFLAELSRQQKRRFKIRLIKGAYWDSEIKHSQEMGFESYPVFTRKASTDVSFLACAKKLLDMPEVFYPQFATHNAYSVAAILEMVGDNREFEFQCLHGMGESLYEHIVPKDKLGIPCRIYAPVGSHKDLLPYLVRRLLENGANSSFVNRIVDDNLPIEELVQDPVEQVSEIEHKPHPQIPLPESIYESGRINSMGLDLSNRELQLELDEKLTHVLSNAWSAAPIINGKEHIEKGRTVYDPSNNQHIIGEVCDASEQQVAQVLDSAHKAYKTWDATPVDERAASLEKAADLFEKHQYDLIALAIREAGKTIEDAVSEVREAVDFCRYYAELARKQIATPLELSGYTGETNQLQLSGKGVFVCISPWNFPLAIFTGQVAAALVTGNTVIAKPAEQTPLIAALAVRLMHAAGVPGDVLQLLPGNGETVGAQLVSDNRIAGVIFTGSTDTARIINQTLAKREGPIATLIAETGGQNAMIVDSSALAEQVVADVLRSAFGSAGQRCSALRVLYIQQDVSEKILKMLKGAMAELRVGDPAYIATDVGPVIDKESQQILLKHIDAMKRDAKYLYATPLNNECDLGAFVAPHAFQIDSLKQLSKENFGPILHVVTYAEKDLDKVINEINATGYGLTFGIHSRIDENINYIQQRIDVGNYYVNRTTIGAMVGVQPFGGHGLSGTGPKAGGPHYLMRLCNEKTITVNTTAAGGNASLMSLQD